MIAIALLVLCPSDADPSTGIYPILLPKNFTDRTYTYMYMMGNIYVYVMDDGFVLSCPVLSCLVSYGDMETWSGALDC